VEPEAYRTNIEQLVRRLKRRARRLVWASTTYVPPDEAGRFQGDDARYNAIAAEIMRRHKIPTDDLHALTASFAPSLFTCRGDVHYTAEGYHKIARAVAACIRRQLP
jgi:lysophospholipase L1-like esterase